MKEKTIADVNTLHAASAEKMKHRSELRFSAISFPSFSLSNVSEGSLEKTAPT